MTDRDTAIWYDGARRERPEALERIEGDALRFLAQGVRDFAGDDSAWVLLLDGLDIPMGLDEEDYGTFARGYLMEVSADRVFVQLSDRLPRKLAATHAALVTKPWCVTAELRKGMIELCVAGLDRAMEQRMAQQISAKSRAVRESMQRGVAEFLTIAAPDPLIRVSEELTESVRSVEELTLAKLERLGAACRGR